MARTIRSDKPRRNPSSGISDSNKPVFAAVIAIIVVFFLMIIFAGVLLVSVLGRFAEDDSAEVTTMTYSIKQRSDFQNGYSYNSGLYESVTNDAYALYGEDGADMEGETTLPNITSNYGSGSEFEYGTIKGNTYKSKFSGITFDAPSGWTLNGASRSTVTPTSVLDLDAHNSSGTMSVKLQYFALSGGNYSSTNEVLKALEAQVGDDVKKDSKSKNISGNNFKGFAFDGMNGQDVARSEVMVAEVKGYALVLQVVAPSQADIDNILKNFS